MFARFRLSARIGRPFRRVAVRLSRDPLMRAQRVAGPEEFPEPAIRRLIEAVKDVDEHLRVMFQGNAGGGIELVILAP